jgi:hypothetical protein
MALLDTISGLLTKNSKSPPIEVPELEPDDWAETTKPTTNDDWEFDSVFGTQTIAELSEQIGTLVNNDQASSMKAYDRLKNLLNSTEEVPQSQFVDEYIPLSTDNEEAVWVRFLERFNLFVSLTPNIVDELSFEMSINEADVKTLTSILQKKEVKKYYIDCLADNLYSFEFDEIPILNGSSKENAINPIEADEEDYNYFSSEETKKSFIANSPLFNDKGPTALSMNYYSMVQAIELELKEVKFQYPKLVGRKIRTVLPCNVTTKEQLDILSMTVPLFDINHFYLQFYSITPVKFGTRVKFSLEAYNLQAPRARPKS